MNAGMLAHARLETLQLSLLLAQVRIAYQMSTDTSSDMGTKTDTTAAPDDTGKDKVKINSGPRAQDAIPRQDSRRPVSIYDGGESYRSQMRGWVSLNCPVQASNVTLRLDAIKTINTLPTGTPPIIPSNMKLNIAPKVP